MNKDQEILAIGRLALELTRLGSADDNLDLFLARLHALLGEISSLRLQRKAAMVLYTPRKRLLRVAQIGMAASWENPNGIPDSKTPLPTEAASLIEIDGAELCSLLDVNQAGERAFSLSLRDDARLLGHIVLFVAADWLPDEMECEFMTDLSHTLSIVIARILLTETLRVREVELENARSEAIRRLGAASEFRDNETGMHIMRMTQYAGAIARAMGLSEAQRELLAICAPMHDVGKIGIPDAILLKPGRLSSDEYKLMQSHTEIGKRLLQGDDELLVTSRQIAGSHHERWDGSGYPQGLKGDEIPLLARICTVADVFDALTSARPYKPRWPVEQATAYVQEQAGRHFDPSAVAAFQQALPEILRIRELYRDDIIDPKSCFKFPENIYRECKWIKWNDTLNIGIDAIDEHHRYLFELTNDLFEVVEHNRGIREVARILKALDQYAQIHFRAEERMMACYGYTRLEQQQQQHERFVERLREFYDELHDNPLTAKFDALTYLRGWLVHHIRHEDAQLRELVAIP